LGRQHGEQASRQIRAHIEMSVPGQNLRTSSSSIRVAKFQPMFARHCPHLLDEMRGLAEGASVTLEGLWRVAFAASWPARREGCTAYAIGPDGTTGHAPLAGQNADMGSQMIPLGICPAPSAPR
jgi:hypothetical protein